MARKRKPTLADREIKEYPSKVRIKEEGNAKRIYQGDDFVGVIERLGPNRWKHANRIGHGGECQTERAAFVQLGFKVSSDPK